MKEEFDASVQQYKIKLWLSDLTDQQRLNINAAIIREIHDQTLPEQEGFVRWMFATCDYFRMLYNREKEWLNSNQATSFELHLQHGEKSIRASNLIRKNRVNHTEEQQLIH